MNVCFKVVGVPQPGGSKRAFLHKHTGKIVMIDTCKKNKTWRENVVLAACQNRTQTDMMMKGPLRLTIEFRLPRPKSHFRTGKNAGELRPDAPTWHTKRPDCTKLIRSTEDALTGVLWLDDSQICEQVAQKVFHEKPGALIRVEEL